MSTLSNTLESPSGPVVATTAERAAAAAHDEAHDLRRRTVRGAFAAGTAQATTLVLRTGSMMILARLLFPADFGLVGMVTAATGFMNFFHDFGLSTASIQRVSVTDEQVSTLFWLNLAAGSLLAGVCVFIAPVLVRFYGEPRLLPITMVIGAGFFFNGAGVQHRALLQRSLRFSAVAAIDTTAIFIGIVAAVAMAASGMGYWALVVMTIAPPAIGSICTWIVTGWVPGPPRRHSGVRSMLWFGGTVTLNSFVVYVAYNTDKLLLGRFWGANVLGLYGRAYQLISIPTENFNSTLSQVALPALARVQKDPDRLRSHFLQGYSLFFAVAVPVTCGCALFADDIIRVFLGPRWTDAAVIFRLLAPTMLAFALLNPFGSLMVAVGRTARSLAMALVIAPVVIFGYTLGLPSGANGVAIGFSGAMVLLAFPLIMWAKRGTLITTHDVLQEIAPALGSIAVAVGLALASRTLTARLNFAFVRLTAETAILWGTYALVLLFGMNRKVRYAKVARDLGLWRR